ncbi:MAG: MMPL family transporter [Spirochaetales bacterium]|nr:MMPL family transporter [Spirochaetales bacterium]
MYRFLHFSHRHPWSIITVFLAVTAFFAFHVPSISIDADFMNLIPPNQEVNQLIEKYGGGQTDYVVLGAEAEDPFTIPKLQAFEKALKKISEGEDVSIAHQPFKQITFEKSGSQLKIVPTAPGQHAPRNQEELETFKNRISNSHFSKNLVISKDLTTLFAYIPSETIQDRGQFISNLNSAVDGLEEHFSVYYAGPSIYKNRTQQYLDQDLTKLIGLSALFIVIMYYFGFRSFRSVLLPFLVIVSGSIWSIGFMGLMGFNITVVTISTVPLVLTLGSSYSIHLLNQYYRLAVPNGIDNEWIVDASTKINKTIFMASITTVIGFSSLLATTVQQTREFGLSTSVGILTCALFSMFFLPAVLSLMRSPSRKEQDRIHSGNLTRSMENFSVHLIQFRHIILIIVVLIAVATALNIKNIKHQSDYLSYFPQNEKVVQDTRFLADKIGGIQQLYVTMEAPEGEKNYFLQPEVLKQIRDFEEELAANEDVYYVVSFSAYLRHLNDVMTGSREIPESRGLILLLSRYFKTMLEYNPDDRTLSILINQDFSRFTILFRVYNTDQHQLYFAEDLVDFKTTMQDLMDEHLDPQTDPVFWGDGLRLTFLSQMIFNDQRISMILSFLLIFFFTSIAFRSLLYGLYSLIPLFIGVMLNYVFMAVFSIAMDMTTVMVTSVAIGVGVDSAIHFIIQYRRQLKKYPENISHVISETLKISGRPIILTNLSIIGGLLILNLGTFVPIRFFGTLVALALTTTAAGTLIILPTFLSLDWSIRKGIGKKWWAPGRHIT